MRLLFAIFFSLSAFAQNASQTSDKAYSRILILSEINLIGFQWQDIGLERESQFLSPMQRQWEKWFKENLPRNVGDVQLCEGVCLSYHSQWEEMSAEELLKSVNEEYKNVLWLKVILNIRRQAYNSNQTFIWDGRVLLVDGNTKKALSTMNLGKEFREWTRASQDEINTGLVSRVYRTPLGHFPEIVRKTETSHPLSRVIKLVITGQRNITDVLKLVDELQKQGSSFGLKVEMREFSTQSAQMTAIFNGEEKSFTDLLSQLKELKSSYNYSLVNEITDNGYVIRMVKQ